MTRRPPARLASVLGTVGLFGIVIWIYWPAVHGGELTDDALEIYSNRSLRSAAGLLHLWLGQVGADYFPLKSTVQWLQWQMWGSLPFGYHVTNLLLHGFGAFLLWRVLLQLRVPWAWFGAAAFAVHPLAVESVAWISELKNCLSLPFLLLSFSAYVDSREPATGRRSIAAILWFLAAILCKISVVAFPLVLVAFEFWQRGAVDPSARRKLAPFAIISVTFGSVGIWFQHAHAIGTGAFAPPPFWDRFAAAGLALAFYLGKSVFPLHLAFIYPRWPVEPYRWGLAVPWILLILVAVAAWRQRSTRGRPVLFALAVFFFGLLPALGLVPLSYQRFSWVADHFAYLALLAPAGAAAVLLAKLPSRPAAGIVALAILVVFAWQSRTYARYFASDQALLTHTLEINPDAWAAHNNLGIDLEAAGRPKEALAQYRQALALKADYADAWDNLATLAAKSEDFPQAISAYRQALRWGPDSPEIHNNLANALAQSGRIAEAIPEYAAALRERPDYASAQLNLGLVYAAQGERRQAIAAFQAVLRIDPSDADAQANLRRLMAQ